MGTNKKINRTLSHQGKCFATMAQRLVHALSFPSFRMFRDECCMSMMKTVAGEDEFSTLTIPNLKTHVDAECNALMKAIKKWYWKITKRDTMIVSASP